MFDHLLESSHRDDSNKWSNIGFGEEIVQAVPIELKFTNLIWASAVLYMANSINTYIVQDGELAFEVVYQRI